MIGHSLGRMDAGSKTHLKSRFGRQFEKRGRCYDYCVLLAGVVAKNLHLQVPRWLDKFFNKHVPCTTPPTTPDHVWVSTWACAVCGVPHSVPPILRNEGQ